MKEKTVSASLREMDAAGNTIKAKNLLHLGNIEHPQINSGEPTPCYKLTEPTTEEWNRKAREANKQAIRNGMAEPPPELLDWFTWAGRDGVAYWIELTEEVKAEKATLHR